MSVGLSPMPGGGLVMGSDPSAGPPLGGIYTAPGAMPGDAWQQWLGGLPGAGAGPLSPLGVFGGPAAGQSLADAAVPPGQASLLYHLDSFKCCRDDGGGCTSCGCGDDGGGCGTDPCPPCVGCPPPGHS